LIVAFLAAIACFVLMPIIGLLLLFIFIPEIFADDTLSWIWVFSGPALFTLLLAVTITVGFVAFLSAEAKLPDRGWRSGQTFVILLTFAATIAAATVIARPHFETPPELGPQQTGLPTLHLSWTLRGTGTRPVVSSPQLLAWSAGDDRLATYGGAGIITWSPDGKYQKQFSPYRNLPKWDVLRYLSGYRLLITRVDSAEEDTAFSVFDSETGKVLQDVLGPHPGGRRPDNVATDLAVSTDERFVAAICGRPKPQINIYATKDWTQVTAINLHAGEKGNAFRASGLAFSSDSKVLAVRGSDSRIAFFEVGSWTPSGSLVPYPDQPMGVVGLGAFAFSPDQTMIAVGSTSGGSWWKYPPGIIVLPGSGGFKQEFPADPLRVFRVSDGKLVASLGSFPGGLSGSGLIWSPNSDYLAFYDALGAIRFWNPLRPGLSVVAARGGNRYGNLLFSKDASRMSANFPDDVRVFDVVPPH
jgi:WD40 repeat protein